MTATRWNLLLGLLLGTAGFARAEEPNPAQAPGEDTTLEQVLGEAELRSLIRDLDSDQFAQRQAATKKLRRVGAAAVPLLAEAALGGSMEVASRAVAILKSYLEVADARIAARQALAQIAASKQTEVASLAREALKSASKGGDNDPDPPVQVFPAVPVPIQLPALQIQGPIRIQVQAQANAGGGRRVQIKQVNQVRDITAEENGVKVKIHDDPDKGIDVEITRSENGKDVTKKYSAKNADELKKKHPEAYREFEKYGQNAGAQIQIQAIPAVPVPVPAERELPARPQRRPRN